MKTQKKGFTLIELLTALCIVAVMATAVIPSFMQILRKTKSTADVNRLVGMINLARYYAVTKNRSLTFCPSISGAQCQGEWHQGALLFEDGNKNGILEPNDRIVAFMPGFTHASLAWRAFQRKQVIQFLPNGLTFYQNGTFTYCDNDGHATLSRLIIINRQGRVRVLKDDDGDGMIIDRKRRRMINCLQPKGGE